MKKNVPFELGSDNSAARRVTSTGISQQMAYTKRTAGISFAWCRENLREHIKAVGTQLNWSDLWAKPLAAEKFHKFRRAIGIGKISEFSGTQNIDFQEYE